MENYLGENETPKPNPKKATTGFTKVLAELEAPHQGTPASTGDPKKSHCAPLVWVSLLAFTALLGAIAAVVGFVILPANAIGEGPLAPPPTPLPSTRLPPTPLPPPPDREKCEAFTESQFLSVDGNGTITVLAQSCRRASCPSGLECRSGICEDGPCCVQVRTVRNSSELSDAVAAKTEIIVVEDVAEYELNSSLSIEIPTLFVGPGSMVNDIKMAVGVTEPMFSLATCTAVKLESISIVRSGFADTFQGDTTAVQVKNSIIRNPVCGNGWKNIDGLKCVQVIPSLGRLRQNSAEKFCEDSGGRLLSVTSLRQIELLGTYCPRCQDAWIGARVTTGPLLSFANGYSGLEDWMLFEGGEVSEESVGTCVAMGSDVAFLWATRDCLEEKQYLCERDIVDAVTTENYGLVRPGSQTTIQTDGSLLEVESYSSMDLILRNARPGDTARYTNADSETFAIPGILEVTVAVQNPSGVTVCEVEAYDINGNLLQMRGANGPRDAVLDGETTTCETDTVWLGVISLEYAEGKLASIVIKNSTLTGSTVVVDGRQSTLMSTTDVDHVIPVTIPKFRIVALGSFDDAQTVQFASDLSTPAAAVVTATSIECGTDFLPRFFHFHRVSTLTGAPTDVVTALEVYSYGNNSIARVRLNQLFRECPHVRALSSPLFSEYKQSGTGIIFELDITLDLKSDGCRQLSLWTEPSLPVPYQMIVDTPSGLSGNVFVAYPETFLLEETNDVAMGTLIDLRPATEIPRIVTLRSISREICVTSVEIRRYGELLVAAPLPDLALLPVTTVNCLAMCGLFTTDISGEMCVRIGTAAVESIVKDIQVSLFSSGCAQIEDINGGTGRNIEQVCSRSVEFIGSATEMQAEISASSNYSELVMGLGLAVALTSSPTAAPTVPDAIAEEIFPDVVDEVIVFDLGTLVATQPLRLVFQPSSSLLIPVVVANGDLAVTQNAVFGFQGLTLEDTLSINVEAGQFAVLEGQVNCNISCAAVNGSCAAEASVLNATWESNAALVLEHTTVAARAKVDARGELTLQNMVIANECALTSLSAVQHVDVLESTPLFVPADNDEENVFNVNETEGTDFEMSNVSAFALCSRGCADSDTCHGFWYESLEPDDNNREIGICKICFNEQCNRVTEGFFELEDVQAEVVYLKKEEAFSFISYAGCLTIEPEDIFLSFDTTFLACKAWCSYYLPCRAITYDGGVCSLYRVDALIDDCGGDGVSPSPVLIPERGTFGQELRSPYAAIDGNDVLKKPDCFKTESLTNFDTKEKCMSICDANIYCTAFGFFEGFGCRLASQQFERFGQEACAVGWEAVPDDASLPALFYSVKDQFPQMEYLDLNLTCRPAEAFDAVQTARKSDCQIQCDIYFSCVSYAFSSPSATSDVNNCRLLNVGQTEKLYLNGFCDNVTEEYSVYTGFVKTDYVVFQPQVDVDQDAVSEDTPREEICELLNTSLVRLIHHTEIPTADDCKAVCTRYTGCERFSYDEAAETCYVPRPSLLACAIDDVSFKETYPLSCMNPTCFQHSSLEEATETCVELGPDDCGGVVHVGGDLYEIRAPSRVIQLTEDGSPSGVAATLFPYECVSRMETLSVAQVNEQVEMYVPVPVFWIFIPHPGFKDDQIGIMPHPAQPTVFNAIIKLEGESGTSIYKYDESPTNRVSWLVCSSIVTNIETRTSFVALATLDHSTEYRATMYKGGRLELMIRIGGVEELFNVTTLAYPDRVGLICNDGTNMIELQKNRELVFAAPAVCGRSIATRLFPEIGLVDQFTAVCHVDFSTRVVAGDDSQLLLRQQEEAALFCVGNHTESFAKIQEVSNARASYVHSFDYRIMLNAQATIQIFDSQINLTRAECQKWCDIHYLCTGYAILEDFVQPTELIFPVFVQSRGSFCGLANSVFVNENSRSVYAEGGLLDYYVSATVPFRDLYTRVPSGACFALRNFENDKEIDGLTASLDCQRSCFNEESCRAFTWDETFRLCTLRTNVDYQTENCPVTAALQNHFIEALSGFYIGAEDVLFGASPLRTVTFTQNVSLKECQALCTLYGSCQSIAHGRLVTGQLNQSALDFEGACFLLGRTTAPVQTLESDLNTMLGRVLVEDLDETETDLKLYNHFQVYSFTTISFDHSNGHFCPDDNALIATVPGTDLFECEALCEAHEDCNSLELDHNAQCSLYNSSSSMLSNIDVFGIYPCSFEIDRPTYRVSFQEFVDPTPLYVTRKESTSDLCIYGSNVLVDNIGTLLLCKRMCTKDECTAGRFIESLQQCVLYTGEFTMESCLASPQEGQLFLPHGPVEFTALPDKCIAEHPRDRAFPAKTQEECAAICTEWLHCRTFTLAANGTCTIRKSAEYVDCVNPDTTLYTFWFDSNYTRLRSQFCVATSFPLAELGNTNAVGCKTVCDKLESCHAFEVERNGPCLLFEMADFSGPCGDVSTRELFISYRHVVDPNLAEATFHGFFEDTCILSGDSPLPSFGSLTEDECEAACLRNSLCKAYEHRTRINDCLLLVVPAANGTVGEEVEYTTTCSVTPVVTKLKAKTNPYRVQNQVDLGSENLLAGMLFDDKEVFECIALCDIHPFCRAFKYFDTQRTCELYEQAREGFGALPLPEAGVTVFVNVHAFVDILSFLGPRGTPIASLAKVSYDTCSAICHVHDGCTSFTHSTKYRFNPYSAVANKRRLTTNLIATEPNGVERDRFLLQFQIVDDEPEQGLVVKRLSHTSDAAFGSDIYIEQAIDQPTKGYIKFSKSKHCLKGTFHSSSTVTVDGQVFPKPIVAECLTDDLMRIIEDGDGFFAIGGLGDNCLSYDSRPGLLGSGDHVLTVYWGACSNPDTTKFSWASPRFYISFDDPISEEAVCLGSDLVFRDCRSQTKQTRWVYNFQNKQIWQSELLLKEELCLTLAVSGADLAKVPCDSLGPTQGRFVVEPGGRIIEDSTENCLTARIGGAASISTCEVGPGALATAQQLQRFGDFERCELRSGGNSQIGVLSENAEGDNAMRTQTILGLPASYYVEDLSNTKLLLVTVDYNRSVIVIVGYTAFDEPQVLDPTLGDTCITRVLGTEDLTAGPCIDETIPEFPRALTSWKISEDDRVFSATLQANTFILCRRPNGQAAQIDDTLCSYEDTRWVLALRGDSSSDGSEYALEPGPVPELPEAPREVLFRLWLQSPDGRLVRSMITKIDIMRALVDSTERQIEEAERALADAQIYIGQLDSVSSTVASQARSNSETARVLADILFPMKRVPYIGPVATVFHRVLNVGAKVLEKGKPKIQNARAVFNRIGGAMNGLQDGMLAAFVTLRPPLDALDTVKEGLKNLQACAFFDGGKLKEDAVRGIIKTVVSAVDFANAGMGNIRSSLEAINGVKPDIILNTGLRPMRSILGAMRPTTRIMRALGFITTVFTYPISFEIPIIGRVSFKLIDIVKAIGRVIEIIKSIPFVGWVVGWIESAVDSVVAAIFGNIRLPLPSFSRDFTGPVRRARDQLIAARDAIIRKSEEIELHFQGAFTGLIPGDFDFSRDLDLESFIPDEIGDLSCLSEECALELPVFSPVADEISQVRTFIQDRLASLDRSFLRNLFIEYLLSLDGCVGIKPIRLQLAKFLPENIRVETCDLNEPRMNVCVIPTFSRGDILENLTQTVRTLFQFTPTQRMMLRRMLETCAGDYCFESMAWQLFAVETSVSVGDALNKFATRINFGQDRFPFTISPASGYFFEFDLSFNLAADVSVKIFNDSFAPEIDSDIEIVIVPSVAVQQVSKPWIVLRKLIQNGNTEVFNAMTDLNCFNTDEDTFAPKACKEMSRVYHRYYVNAKWSKGNRLTVFQLQRLLKYPLGSDEPGFLAKKTIQNAASRQIISLLRRHVKDTIKEITIEARRGHLEIKKTSKLVQLGIRTVNLVRRSPWRPVEFDGGFFSFILRPKVGVVSDTEIAGSSLQYGNAMSFAFDLERIPRVPGLSVFAPKAMYIALDFPMNGPLLIAGAPKPRIAISFGTRPLSEQIGCYALRLGCLDGDKIKPTLNPRFLTTCQAIRDYCITDSSDRNDLINRKVTTVTFAYGLGDPLRGKALGVM